MRRKEMKLSYSSCKDFTMCKRKFWWSYIAGLELIEKPMPMLMGSIMSQHLDAIHSKDNPPIAYDWTHHIIEEAAMPIQLHGLRGLIKGYAEKFGEMKGSTQVEFEWREDGFPRVHGYMDMTYHNTIGYEMKYTARQEAYSKFAIQDQLATYFLGNGAIERITLRAILVPQLRQGRNEAPEDYEERVYQDFLHRPGYYVKDTNYWKEEFNYIELKIKLQMIAQDIYRYLEAGTIDAFYQSNGPNTCFGDTTGRATINCPYLSICVNGVVSEGMYQKRQRRW